MQKLDTRSTNNDIASLIDALTLIQSQYGNLKTFDIEMEPLDAFRIHVGETNYDKENCPDGYIVPC